MGYSTGIIGGVALTLILIAVAFYMRRNDAAFRARAQPGVATVVAHEQTVRRDERDEKHVDEFDVYEYTSQSGQKTTFVQPISALRPRRTVGETAAILYDPNDLNDARMDDDAMTRTSTWLLWASPFGLVIAAIFFAVSRRSAAARSNLERGARDLEHAPASERAE